MPEPPHDVAAAAPVPEPVVFSQPTRWHCSREAYYRMLDLGLFAGVRAELIEGEILVFSPQKFGHTSCIARVHRALSEVFATGYWVRMQFPLHLPDDSEPEPDVSVVRGSLDDYSDHPTSAVLVVEISDATLNFDRQRKATVYARAGIGEYWIVNMVKRHLEVYRSPAADETLPGGYGYTSVQVIDSGEIVPLGAPEKRIPVESLLPPSAPPGTQESS